ncbi:hypothetical protein [Rhodococcus rhodochrous]|uniref:hypothetical protein n=1 Tax=Rhodococcus rhodochrous TaxID=1829 RepID=UPI00177D94F7|nr:hypothetical protein [Rhodococcus rhodochrous]
MKWDEVPHLFEDMVSVLLSTLHPNARRIDGSGGDGGRDVQILEDGELHIFECKSFTGRIAPKSPNRRSQVEKSLKTAMAHQPDSWTLIVPIDPTPDEEKWFNGLKEKFGIECPMYWLGRDWLDRQMGNHPAIKRYFVDGVNDEVVRLLREISKEQAALDGDLIGGLERLQNLATRINELDPYYRIDISITGDQTSVSHTPRWKGAEEESPISFGIKFKFPDTELGRLESEKFRNSIERGEAVTVDSQYVTITHASGAIGISDILGKSAKIAIGSTRAPIEQELHGRIVIYGPTGQRKSSLPVRFTQRQLGSRVSSIHGQDKTGSIHISAELVESEFNHGSKYNVKVIFEPVDGLYPHDLLIVYRFASHLCNPNRIQLELGDASPIGDPVAIEGTDTFPDLPITLLEKLARIQAVANEPFSVSSTFTHDDAKQIEIATHLLDGEEINVRESREFIRPIPLEWIEEPEGKANLLSQLENQIQFLLPMSQQFEICGQKLFLGDGIYFCPNVKVDNLEELRSFLHGDKPAEPFMVHLSPTAGTPVTFRLLRDDDPPEFKDLGLVRLYPLSVASEPRADS